MCCPKCGCQEFRLAYEVIKYPFKIKVAEHYVVVVCKKCQSGYLIRKEELE